MARRGLKGQLNMFDFFGPDSEPVGEVQMVSLMPGAEEPEVMEELKAIEEPKEIEESEILEEPEGIEIPEKKEELPVMSRKYEKDGVAVEIAYYNYNKVQIKEGNNAPVMKVFATSKEAVDFYVGQMQGVEE